MSSTTAAGCRAKRWARTRALVAVSVARLATGCEAGHGPLTFDGGSTAAWVAELDAADPDSTHR